MIKKYKHMREDFEMNDFTPEEQEIINSEDDMPDDFFPAEEDEDIWDDDSYIEVDDDIHKTDLAESPDDEDFSDFDDEDTIDVEDPEYWKDAKELDPNDIDVGDELDDFQNDDSAWVEPIHHDDPAHSEEFKRIMSLEDMPESKKEVKKNKLKEDSAFFCSNKPKDENRDLPEWVYQKFGKIYESCTKK